MCLLWCGGVGLVFCVGGRVALLPVLSRRVIGFGLFVCGFLRCLCSCAGGWCSRFFMFVVALVFVWCGGFFCCGLLVWFVVVGCFCVCVW